MTRFTAEVLPVAELLAKGRFAVPWHQRYYDWSTEEVKELLVDLSEAIEEGRSSYFLGSVMLVNTGAIWQINDGQQRMITLSLVAAALGRRFAQRRPEETSREALALRLLFDRSPHAVTSMDDTTKDSPRISPPRQDRSVYTQIIRGHDIGTNGKMVSAWNEISVMPWKEACKRLNEVPWEITEENMGGVWQRVLWSGGIDGKVITKNREISARLIAYMAGEELDDEAEAQLLEKYRSLFPEAERRGKALPPRVVVG